MLDQGLVRGVIVVVTLVTFLGICWWAYRPANRSRFEADSWLAFGEDEIPEAGAKPVADEGERRS